MLSLPPVNDGLTAEPSEAKLKRWVTALALTLGPLLFFVLYFRSQFYGLSHLEAMDFAQLGRNIQSGQGFVTYVLRPLDFTAGANPLRQPETIHGPLYPFILALAFGMRGPQDAVVAGVSGFFYLLTLPLIYLLGKRLFDHRVGMASAVIFALSPLVLEYAVSGLHVTFYTFLFSLLFLILHDLAREQPEGNEERIPRGKLVQAGLITGALYLTDTIFLWTIPVIAGVVFYLCRKRGTSPFGFLIPLAILMFPWMLRNFMVEGRPFFGLRGYELYMATSRYPGEIVYRMSGEELTFGLRVLNGFIGKVLVQSGTVVRELLHLPSGWLMAFFLPGLFYGFRDPAASLLRRIVLALFFAIFIGTVFFTLRMELFTGLVPLVLIFAVAYLFQLIEQTQTSRAQLRMAFSVVGILIFLPLMAGWMGPKKRGSHAYLSAQSLNGLAQRGEVVFTDEPRLVAWYANRPALWIPANERNLRQLRSRIPGSHWLFLTDGVRDYSRDWKNIYDVFQQWNMVNVYARNSRQPAPQAITIGGNTTPPVEALNGFSTVASPEAVTQEAVIAAAPAAASSLGQNRDRSNTASRSPVVGKNKS